MPMPKHLLASSALALSLAFLPLYPSATAQQATDEPAGETEVVPEAAETEPEAEPETEAAEDEPAEPEVEAAEDEPEVPDEAELAEEEPKAPPSGFIAEQEPDWMRTEAIKSMTVYTAADESLGSVQDLILDEDERVIGAVLAVGGFLGIGAKKVALSWDMFQPGPEEGTLLVQTTREELDAAPDFQTIEDIVAAREAERVEPAADPMAPPVD